MANVQYIQAVLEDAIDQLKDKGLTDELIDIYSFEIIEGDNFIFDTPCQLDSSKEMYVKTSKFDWLGCLVALSREYLKLYDSSGELKELISDKWRVYERQLLNDTNMKDLLPSLEREQQTSKGRSKGGKNKAAAEKKEREDHDLKIVAYAKKLLKENGRSKRELSGLVALSGIVKGPGRRKDGLSIRQVREILKKHNVI